jgi:hypothetical protein
VLAACLTAWAQTPLENTGKPMLVSFACTEDDIESTGLSCPEERPCPVYLELSGLETAGNKIFTAGNLHTSDATLYTVLLASRDGGKTWNEPTARLRAASLDEIQFIDFENGLVSGQDLKPLPRDPFFLVTADGGMTWKRRAIFDDEHFGAIEQFHFDSLQNGRVLLAIGANARRELYETTTGGNTWTLRQANPDPIRLSPAHKSEEASDWRLRADAKTRTYQIEQRKDSGWQAVAEFLIDLGVCRQ